MRLLPGPHCLLYICAVLPLYPPPDYYKLSAEEDAVMDEYTSVFMRMTISNISQGSPKLW